MSGQNEKTICFDEKGLAEFKKFISDKALIEAMAHLEPSEETKKTFKFMNEELTNIKVTLAEIKTDTRYSKEKLDDHISKEDEATEKLAKANDEAIKKMSKAYEEFIKSATKTFASKTTEKIVYGVVAIILTSFAYAMVRYIIPEQKQITAAEIQTMIETNNNKYFEKTK